MSRKSTPSEPDRVSVPRKRKRAKTPTAPEAGSSLLERASGAFGLDSLAASPPPQVDESTPSRFVPRRAPSPSPAVAPAPASLGKATDAMVERAAPPRIFAAGQAAVRFTQPTRTVARHLLRDQGMIDPDGGASALLEEFRIVKRQILATAKAAGGELARRILVCSPHPDEGKTFCAINLALAMAGERDSEVILVDADFAKPSVMSRLGIDASAGFMDVLADPAVQIEDYVLPTDIPGLSVLPAGKRSGRDAEFLASSRTEDVLIRLMQGAPGRYLVFDSPPALAASPAAELAKHVGQSLLVARADVTGKAALEDAVDLLSGCPDIKLLLNDATFSPSGRRFGSYYGYGE